MAANLTEFLFETHGAGWPDADQPANVSAAHVVLDEDGAVIALLAFEALGEPRVRVPLALVAPARDAAGPDALADLRYLRTAAAAFGLRFARPGAGPAAALHRRRFAAPGSCLASPAAGAAGAGAFGMLAFAATPLECAAALAGRPLLRARPRVLGVRLTGELPAGAGGSEALARLAGLLGADARGAVLEFGGDGLARLPMAERIAMASLAPRVTGAAAALFPCDAATREYLAARGREDDWRRFEGAGGGFDRETEFDLGAVAPPPLAEEAALRVGPFAEDDDLRTLADALASRPGAGARVQVVIGGRAARAALAADGTLERLAAAGVAVREAGDPEAGVAPAPGTLALGDEDALERGARPASAAALAAALAGESGARARTIAAPGSAALDPAELAAAAEGPAAIERGPAHRVPEPLPPLAGSLRGVVLVRGAGRVTCEQLLPWGPRTRALRGDARALAAQWGRGLDADAAARGLVCGGGFAVADGEWGAGEPAEDAARATAALGVRAVLAGTFADAHHRALVRCGVLPLRWTRTGDAANVESGDELELPMLAEMLAGGGRVTVRHLTRGLSFAVVHDLDARSRAWVLAGGLLGAALETERT